MKLWTVQCYYQHWDFQSCTCTNTGILEKSYLSLCCTCTNGGILEKTYLSLVHKSFWGCSCHLWDHYPKPPKSAEKNVQPSQGFGLCYILTHFSQLGSHMHSSPFFPKTDSTQHRSHHLLLSFRDSIAFWSPFPPKLGLVFFQCCCLSMIWSLLLLLPSHLIPHVYPSSHWHDL